ncbi:MAG TPA: amidohydrolase family protein [Streptosporangiaceae bacterium]|nr:amidohydrolase family protein [Streptosporangiaceae bacterium]
MADQVLVNCNVFDGHGDAVLTDQRILVRDGRIAALGPRDPGGARDGAAVIDLGGAYVMAGLFNMHTHFSLALPGALGREVLAMSPHELAFYVADGAHRTLRCGVTSVRCVGESDHVDFALRSAIAAGRAEGPRIFTAGRALVCTGGHGHEAPSALECDGPDGFTRGTRAQIKAGADLIKVMISGGIAGLNEAIDTMPLTPAELGAVIATAHAWGRKVTAHAGPAPIIEQAVDLGLDCVEHGYQLTAAVAGQMRDRGAALVPTLGVTRCAEFFDSLEVPAWMQQRSFAAAPRHEESYRLALAAGVEVMLGSDLPPFWAVDGTSATVRELEHMQEFGLPARDALLAATRGPAAWLGVADELGSVAVGKRADLIAMTGDPTASVGALRTLCWVMKDGAVVRDDRGCGVSGDE